VTLQPALPVLVVLLVASCGDDGAGAPAPERPAVTFDGDGLPTVRDAHLLLITVDALRPDHLGAFGYERDISPTFDRLAAESTVFERAYAQAPHSSHSLCSLMTGDYLHELVQLQRPLPEATLASTLQESGYRTHAIFTSGIYYTDAEDLATYRESDLGFESVVDTAAPASDVTDEALDIVDDLAGDGEPKSFLWVHYFDAHEPYRDTSLGTSAVDRYDSEIRNVDRAVGRLLAGVRERLRRPVVVVLTADHGEEFRDHGGVSSCTRSRSACRSSSGSTITTRAASTYRWSSWTSLRRCCPSSACGPRGPRVATTSGPCWWVGTSTSARRSPPSLASGR